MKHAASVIISRTVHGEVSIRVVDDNSGIELVRLLMSTEAFGGAVTGLGYQTASAEYLDPGHADRLGKIKVVESRSIAYTGPAHKKYDREYLSNWLLTSAVEDGWFVDPYLGSRGSVTSRGLYDTTLNYRVYKFVDAPKGE